MEAGTVIREKLPPKSNWCLGTSTFTYFPDEEKIESITKKNSATHPGCPAQSTSTIYRLKLKSPSRYCVDQPVELSITGQNVKWYADADKKQLVHEGNTFKPGITSTTTFYVSQSQYNMESLVVPIKIEIIDPPLITTTLTAETCGQANGSITVTSTNQVQYSLNNGAFQNTSVFDNLKPSNYTLQAKNTAGCLTTKEITIARQEVPKINAVFAINPQCGDDKGSLTIEASGGTGLLSYSLNGKDFKTDSQFEKLTGGNFTVTVKDQNQCSASQSISLKQTRKLQLKDLSVNSTTCGQSNGLISLSTNEGNGRIQFSLDGATNQASGIFDHLKAGVYTVSVEDEAGCTDIKSVTVAGSVGPKITQVTIEAATCDQLNAKLSAQTTGIPNLTYELNGVVVPSLANIDKLAAGTYKVVVRDQNGCSIDTSFIISQQGSPIITMVTGRNPVCDKTNGALTIVARSNSELLAYSIDGIHFRSTPDFEELQAGDYLVQVRDVNNCLVTSKATLCPEPLKMSQ